MDRPRGAFPSPRHSLAGATPHSITTNAPPQWLWLPTKLSFWLNEVDGDCVTAEEAFAKACYQPEIFIEDQTVQTWASERGFMNGANLIDVLDAMASNGFKQDGHIYGDGPATSVDWTNTAILQNAIYSSPVKIGVAADQLENAVPNPPVNGWIATGFQWDRNEDHCVSLCGYGALSWLLERLGGTLPAGVDPSTPGYALFTWNSIGAIDVPSMLAITGEAWLRNPTTLVKKTEWNRKHNPQ